jgi:cation diffusion facilitator family transporter
MSAPNSSLKVILFAMFANLGIALAKFTGAWFSKSASMMSEGIHSLVDTTNQLLLILGAKKAQKPASDLHPLGYGTESFFWSFIVAILLFSMGGIFSVYEGVHKFNGENEIQSPAISVGILIVSVILESLSFRACLHEVRQQNPYGSLREWFKRTTSADLLVVFTEDLAALLGLLIALFCLILNWWTGDSRWDAVGSIIIGILLVCVALVLAIKIKSLIVGEAPSTDYRTFVESRVNHWIPGGELLRFIAIQKGGNEVLLAYKVSPGSLVETKKLIDAINQLEKDVKNQFKEVAWQFVEPDYHA